MELSREEVYKFTGILEVIVNSCHDNSKKHGFWNEGHDNIYEKLALVHSEISEVLEDFRDKKDPLHIGFNYERALKNELGQEVPKPEGIAPEIADVFIRFFDICGKYNIPLGEAIILKMEYNKLRPHMHGKDA